MAAFLLFHQSHPFHFCFTFSATVCHHSRLQFVIFLFQQMSFAVSNEPQQFILFNGLKWITFLNLITFITFNCLTFTYQKVYSVCCGTWQISEKRPTQNIGACFENTISHPKHNGCVRNLHSKNPTSYVGGRE